MIAIALLSGCGGTREPATPRRLLAADSDTVIVNNRRAVPIPMRAFDAVGDSVPAAGVRYVRTAGDSLDVTPDGRVTCTRRGDATIHASLGAISTTVVLRCRPVQALHIAGPIQFLLGDSSLRIPLDARGLDGEPVDLIAGSVSTQRANVVAVEPGLRLNARTVGVSLISVLVGDLEARVGAHVYERVATLDGIRADQRLVAVPLLLASGEIRRWQLPAGQWMFTMMPYEDEKVGLRLRVEGAVCMREPLSARRIVCEAKHAATIIVYHPTTTTAPAKTGMLLVRRVNS